MYACWPEIVSGWSRERKDASKHAWDNGVRSGYAIVFQSLIGVVQQTTAFQVSVRTLECEGMWGSLHDSHDGRVTKATQEMRRSTTCIFCTVQIQDFHVCSAFICADVSAIAVDERGGGLWSTPDIRACTSLRTGYGRRNSLPPQPLMCIAPSVSPSACHFRVNVRWAAAAGLALGSSHKVNRHHHLLKSLTWMAYIIIAKILNNGRLK